MNLADELVRHHLLSNGPVGRWRTLPGSHTQLFDEAIVFEPDGRGELGTRSVMRGDERLRFMWRVSGYGLIDCQPVYEQPELDADGEPEVADWFRIAFVIERQRSDAGEHWVLKERHAPGFWELTAPLVPA